MILFLKNPGSFCLRAGLLFFISAVYAEEVDLPQPIPIEQYQVIWTRSPFTAPTATEEEKSSGTWILTGLAGSTDDPIVLLENKESQERAIVTREKNEKGFQVLSVNPQADLFQSTARIRIPGQDLNVQFDKDLIASRNPPPMTQPFPVAAQGFSNRMPPDFSGPRPNGMPNHPIHRIVIPTPPPAPVKK